MKEEIIIAGFGGQGVMLAGKILAYAAMKKGFKVSWMPSYGPEMRGGTANCTVIISSKKIASPFSSSPNTIFVMNNPSKDKFLPQLKSGGLIILNSSLINNNGGRNDVKSIYIDANDIANNLGNKRVANMVMLGAYLEAKNIISINSVQKVIKKVLPEHRWNLIPINKKALVMGRKAVDSKMLVI